MVRSSQDDGVIKTNCGIRVIGSSKTPQAADVTRHLTDNPNPAVCFNNPIILARSDHRQKFKDLIKETLMIHQRNPDLNSNRS